MKSFYWIIAIIVIFVGFVGVAAYFKDRSTDGGPIPTIEVTAEDHTKGNGQFTLVEYSDFQCPACRSYYPIVEEFLKQKGEEVTFVYRHFPLPQHGNAFPSAQASEAAGNQGKFFEMYSKLFEGQDEWATLSAAKAFEVFKKYASELGLDMVRFESDYNLKEIKAKIQNSYKGGVALKVDQTPSFFLNGKKIENPQSLEGFLNLIAASTSSSPLQIDYTQL